MNLRLEAKAKSRTFLALKCQVLVFVERDFSFSNASSTVTINTGFLAVFALAKRLRCVLVNTFFGFCSSPVAATI